ALAPRMATYGRRALSTLDRLDSEPQAANMALLSCWGVTRLLLVLGMVLGRHFCDPYFYHYAGQFAAGQWPYNPIPVEYPPLAMVLLLLPALPLLLFANIAPRPDAAFTPPITHIPQPDLVRYSAYGLSFAIEMLLIDVLTLWLVRVAARRFFPADRQGLRAGLLYILLIFLNGALLQKFDLVAGALVLAAVLALTSGRTRAAWLALAAATLVKGFPILLVPCFALYLAVARARAREVPWWRAFLDELAGAVAWCGGALALVTLPVALLAGIAPIVHTVTYHTGRGTEIESLYANVMLALGWLPGLGATTAFNGNDLSRVVISPLDRYADVASYLVLGALLLAAYASLGWAWLGRRWAAARDRVNDTLGQAQILALGVAAILLAFTLAFRALPAHYLLVLLPLAVVIRLPGRRQQFVWLGALIGAAVLGQVMTMVWDPLRDLVPWAVALLSARNLCWLLLLGVAIAGPSLWARAMTPGGAVPLPGARRRLRAPLRRLARRWSRLTAAAPPIPGFNPRQEDVAVHLLSRVNPAVLVVGAGLASALIYLGLVLAFPITLLYSHPHVGHDSQIINDMGRITGYAPLAAFGFVGAVLGLFLCQFLALVAAGRLTHQEGLTERSKRLAHYGALLFPAAFILIMIWMQPVTTTDLYGYVARGYLYVFKHGNPMTTIATLLPGGLEVNRPAAPYGPAWLLIAAAVSRVTGEHLLANMLAFKVIEALATLGSLVLIDLLARHLFPERRLRIQVLFGWSPLLIYEAIGNGHNDIVMMLCVLAAFLLMVRGWPRTALAFFVLGAAIKYFAAVFVPFWFVYELRRRGRAKRHPAGEAALATGVLATEAPATEAPTGGAPLPSLSGMVRGQAHALAQTLHEVDRKAAVNLLVSATLIGGAILALCYAPFWVGPHTFTGLGQQLRPLYYNNSIVNFITAPLQLIVPPKDFGALDKTVRLVCYTLFGAYVLVQLNRVWQGGRLTTMRELLTATAKVTFAGLIIITFWYQPWYVVWLLPLAARTSESYVRRAATILAAGSLMTYAVSNFLLVNETGLGKDLFVQFFEILVTFGPLLLLRAAPYEEGLLSIARRYLGSLGAGLRQYPVFWERIMLVLVLIVAALLRLLRLGNLFTPLDTPGAPSELKQISGDLGLFLSDPQGLHAPFVLLQRGLVYLFGPTPLAVLLPSAVIGTLTVLVIFLLTKEIMHQGRLPGAYGIALLAALLAATSRWHVSLSRSGTEIVLLPLLICTALYWLLLAFRLGAPTHAVGEMSPAARAAGAAGSVSADKAADAEAGTHGRHRRLSLLLYAGCGICTGLASDLAPGLWLLPLLVIGFLLIWRQRVPAWFTGVRWRVGALLGGAVISGLPA
ncbi:MAG TPA: glycosyltransferase family 39 protein, partial [Ktedonobacterales bacterium]